MSKKTDQLEIGLLELGTELYRIKHQVHGLEQEKQAFMSFVKQLKGALEERGFDGIEALGLGAKAKEWIDSDSVESSGDQLSRSKGPLH